MKLNYKIEINEVSDIYVGVAIDYETSKPQKMFRLNDTGVVIIKALQDGLNQEEITTKVMDSFIVDEAKAKVEVAAFIQTLIDNGLVSE